MSGPSARVVARSGSVVMPDFTAQQISDRVGGDLVGPRDLTVRGVEQLDCAAPDQISFVRDARNVAAWTESRAGVVLAARQLELACDNGRAVIHVDNADLALVSVLNMFAPAPVVPPAGVHPSATVDPTAQLGAAVAIGPSCVVGAGVEIGDGCVLQPQVCLMDHVTVGRRCLLYPGVVVRERCALGDDVILHPNAVIGADGFGYTPSRDGSRLVKIPQIGTVKIGNDVEIGAGTCIDRGKHSATVIGDGTKIDNLCQIAHNCIIGRHCAIAGQTGLAGSVTIGDGAMLGGNVGVKDQLHIGAGATIAGHAAVMHDVPAGATWGGYPAQDLHQTMRQIAAVRKLPDALKERFTGGPARAEPAAPQDDTSDSP